MASATRSTFPTTLYSCRKRDLPTMPNARHVQLSTALPHLQRCRQTHCSTASRAEHHSPVSETKLHFVWTTPASARGNARSKAPSASCPNRDAEPSFVGQDH